MKTVMISQPMNGKTDEEIQYVRNQVKSKLEKLGYEVVNSYFNVEPENKKFPALWYLGESLKIMSNCDCVYFCKGWDSTRGCYMEYAAAKQYGLEVLFEDEV